MKNGKKTTGMPSRKVSAADELEGAASHRSFRGAPELRFAERARSDPMADDEKGRKVVHPSKGEISPRD